MLLFFGAKIQIVLVIASVAISSNETFQCDFQTVCLRANFSWWRKFDLCVYVQYITWAVVMMMMMGRIWVEMMDDHGPPRVRRKPLRRKKQPQASLCQNRERWGVHLLLLDPLFQPKQHGSLTSRWNMMTGALTWWWYLSSSQVSSQW